MIKLVFSLTAIYLVTMIISIYFKVQYALLIINLIVNGIYFCLQICEKQKEQKLSGIILNGEVLFSCLYTVWILFLQSKQYVFYLPLAVSMSIKTYHILTAKNNRNQTVSQNYILFQGKLEFLVLIYLVVLTTINSITLNLNLKSLILFVSAILIFRVKYSVNYAFQKSINEFHMSFDRIAKKIGFRNPYHTVYELALKISRPRDYYGGKRVIRY